MSDRKYKFAKTRNKGFRRDSGAPDNALQTGEKSCDITLENNQVCDEAISQAISQVLPLSNSREQLKTETKDTTDKSCNKPCNEPSKVAKPDCYKCAYRGEIPGNAHSRCRHPALNGATDSDMAMMFSMMGSRGLRAFNMGDALFDILNIKAHQHGVDRGWFHWPINFDPAWLEQCDGFEEKK